jgi:hypothetical protein
MSSNSPILTPSLTPFESSQSRSPVGNYIDVKNHKIDKNTKISFGKGLGKGLLIIDEHKPKGLRVYTADQNVTMNYDENGLYLNDNSKGIFKSDSFISLGEHLNEILLGSEINETNATYVYDFLKSNLNIEYYRLVNGKLNFIGFFGDNFDYDLIPNELKKQSIPMVEDGVVKKELPMPNEFIVFVEKNNEEPKNDLSNATAIIFAEDLNDVFFNKKQLPKIKDTINADEISEKINAHEKEIDKINDNIKKNKKTIETIATEKKKIIETIEKNNDKISENNNVIKSTDNNNASTKKQIKINEKLEKENTELEQKYKNKTQEENEKKIELKKNNTYLTAYIKKIDKLKQMLKTKEEQNKNRRTPSAYVSKLPLPPAPPAPPAQSKGKKGGSLYRKSSKKNNKKNSNRRTHRK